LLHIYVRKKIDNRTLKEIESINTLRTGDAGLRFYITTVQDG